MLSSTTILLLGNYSKCTMFVLYIIRTRVTFAHLVTLALLVHFRCDIRLTQGGAHLSIQITCHPVSSELDEMCAWLQFARTVTNPELCIATNHIERRLWRHFHLASTTPPP